MAGQEDLASGWEEFYQQHAPDRLPWERFKPDTNLVNLVNKGVIKPGRVLDICSGLGTQAIYLAQQGFDVYGVDISPTAVNIAKRRCLNKGVACNLRVGDAADLWYPDEFFTFIFDRGCFHSLPPQKRRGFIRGIHRVLEREGKYQMTCFSFKNGPAPNHFTIDAIKGYFSPFFTILSIKEEVVNENISEFRKYFYIWLMEKK